MGLFDANVSAGAHAAEGIGSMGALAPAPPPAMGRVVGIKPLMDAVGLGGAIAIGHSLDRRAAKDFNDMAARRHVGNYNGQKVTAP